MLSSRFLTLAECSVGNTCNYLSKLKNSADAGVVLGIHAINMRKEVEIQVKEILAQDVLTDLKVAHTRLVQIDFSLLMGPQDGDNFILELIELCYW